MQVFSQGASQGASSINAGFAGIQRSQQNIQDNAQTIASAGTEQNRVAQPGIASASSNPNQGAVDSTGRLPVTQSNSSQSINNTQSNAEFIEAAVELNANEAVFNASAKVISVADESLGSLIDIRA